MKIKKLTIRQRTTLYTIAASLLPNVLIMLLGAVKTRLIIDCLGSDTNGAYQIMLQLSSFVMFANLGIDSSFRLAYYKYLSQEETEETTAIYNYSKRFFKKMSVMMLGISCCISIISIFFVGDYLDFYQTIILQFLLCLPSVTNFYIGKDVALVNARQKGYTYLLLYNCTYIVRLIVSLFLIIVFRNTFLFLCVDAMLYSITNLMIGIFLKKDNETVLVETDKENKEPIKTNKYILTFKLSKQVFYNTDGLVLSLFLSKTAISIYSTYMYIANCLVSIASYVTTSFQNSLGNLFHSNENYKEIIVRKLCVMTIISTLILTVPLTIGMESFVMNIWINDSNYMINDGLYFLICLYFSLSAFKYFIELIEDSANLYSKTYKINLFEAFTNIVLSLLFLIKHGISGVAMATIVSMFVSIFVKQVIMFRNMNMNIKKQLQDFFIFVVMTVCEIILCMMFLNGLNILSFWNWVITMCFVTVTSLVLNAGISYLLYHEFKEVVDDFLCKLKGE